jgi:hypothetical protein
MTERMTPERLDEIEDAVNKVYSSPYMQTIGDIAWYEMWKEAIAEIKASWSEIKVLKHEERP